VADLRWGVPLKRLSEAIIRHRRLPLRRTSRPPPQVSSNLFRTYTVKV